MVHLSYSSHFFYNRSGLSHVPEDTFGRVIATQVWEGWHLLFPRAKTEQSNKYQTYLIFIRHLADHVTLINEIWAVSVTSTVAWMIENFMYYHFKFNKYPQWQSNHIWLNLTFNFLLIITFSVSLLHMISFALCGFFYFLFYIFCIKF